MVSFWGVLQVSVSLRRKDMQPRAHPASPLPQVFVKTKSYIVYQICLLLGARCAYRRVHKTHGTSKSEVAYYEITSWTTITRARRTLGSPLSPHLSSTTMDCTSERNALVIYIENRLYHAFTCVTGYNSAERVLRLRAFSTTSTNQVPTSLVHDCRHLQPYISPKV